MEGQNNQQIIKEMKKSSVFISKQKENKQQEKHQKDRNENKQKEIAKKTTPFISGIPPLLEEEIRILQPVTRPQEDQLRKKDKDKLVEQRRKDYNLIGKEMKLTSFAKVHNCSYFSTKIGREDFKKRNAEFLTGQERLEEITMDYVAKRVLESDYANFENADLTVRNVAATMAYRKFKETYNPNPGMDPEELCDRIKATKEGVTALLNPALRLGLSLAIKSDDREVSPQMKVFLQKLDEAMSTRVMYETISHIAQEEEVEALIKEKEPQLEGQALIEKRKAMIEANEAQQIQIAKRLLLMQLSNFEKINDSGSSEPWDKSMAVALSHCSRVVITFSNVEKNSEGNTQEDHDHLYEVIHKTREGNVAQDNHRIASTHNILMRKVGTRGPIRTKEKKWYVGNYINQRGMNCAIGGLGQKGIGEKRLSNDGSCGHFYSMFKKAEAGYHGAMLMGLESDASGMVNQMGHKHTWKAKGEHASSLGGQRTDEVGKKYGGRQCDLSHLSAKQVTEALQNLEIQMREYQQKVRRKESGTEVFEAYLKKLVGVKFNPLNPTV